MKTYLIFLFSFSLYALALPQFDSISNGVDYNFKKKQLEHDKEDHIAAVKREEVKSDQNVADLERTIGYKTQDLNNQAKANNQTFDEAKQMYAQNLKNFGKMEQQYDENIAQKQSEITQLAGLYSQEDNLRKLKIGDMQKQADELSVENPFA